MQCNLCRKMCHICHLPVVCAVQLVEDVKHYFLFCPRFAALRETLFSSAVHLLGDRWLSASDKKEIDFLLNGVPGLDF